MHNGRDVIASKRMVKAIDQKEWLKRLIRKMIIKSTQKEWLERMIKAIADW